MVASRVCMWFVFVLIEPDVCFSVLLPRSTRIDLPAAHSIILWHSSLRVDLPADHFKRPNLP